MKIAVVTPYHGTPQPWLERCLRSVREQTGPCTHFLVCDGEAFAEEQPNPALQVIRLPQPHGMGNTARAVGAICAIAQDFKGIAFLDADNWFEPTHLQLLIDFQAQNGSAFCSSARNLFTRDEELLGICPEVDGERFVDPNCMMFFEPGFKLLAAWYLMPTLLNRNGGGDRFVWEAVKRSNVKRFHHSMPTVGYRTRYAEHYQYFGRQAPADAKLSVKPKAENNVRG